MSENSHFIDCYHKNTDRYNFNDFNSDFLKRLMMGRFTVNNLTDLDEKKVCIKTIIFSEVMQLKKSIWNSYKEN